MLPPIWKLFACASLAALCLPSHAEQAASDKGDASTLNGLFGQFKRAAGGAVEAADKKLENSLGTSGHGGDGVEKLKASGYYKLFEKANALQDPKGVLPAVAVEITKFNFPDNRDEMRKHWDGGRMVVSSEDASLCMTFDLTIWVKGKGEAKQLTFEQKRDGYLALQNAGKTQEAKAFLAEHSAEGQSQKSSKSTKVSNIQLCVRDMLNEGALFKGMGWSSKWAGLSVTGVQHTGENRTTGPKPPQRVYSDQKFPRLLHGDAGQLIGFLMQLLGYNEDMGLQRFWVVSVQE